MARSVGEAAAQGIESGFGMGLQLDRMQEEKRARAFQENRQLEIDRRAESDAEIRRKREDRQERRLVDTERNAATDRAHRLLKERQGEITNAARGAQEAGGPVPPELAAEYGQNAEALARVRQDALNYFSRVQSGQASLDDASPKDLYMHFTAATGMRPEDLPRVQQHIADVQAGMETGNRGLLLQGVNGLMAPQLKKGLGGPSPHGGTIIRKEVIGLDPARDAAGGDHPDKFIPRLRVYVKTDDGKTAYYDAPVTKNRSTDPNDPVVAVGIDQAMDYMGNLGVLATAVEHPEVAAKIAQGAKEAGPAAQRYLDELTAASRPKKTGSTTKAFNLPADSGETILQTTDAQGKVTERRIQHNKREFRPASGGRGGAALGKMQAVLEQLDVDYEAEISEAESPEEAAKITEQYKEDRRAVLTSIRPSRTTTKPPTNAEVNSAVRDAVKIAAGKIGLSYDAGIKDYRNQDGTPVTPAQRKQLADAEAAAIKAVRNIAAGGKKPTGEDVSNAAGSAKKTVKWGELK
jgi:hypothetical protein